jgi:hypothetical protein
MVAAELVVKIAVLVPRILHALSANFPKALLELWRVAGTAGGYKQ